MMMNKDNLRRILVLVWVLVLLVAVWLLWPQPPAAPLSVDESATSEVSNGVTGVELQGGASGQQLQGADLPLDVSNVIESTSGVQ